jgi:hypothetical protein
LLILQPTSTAIPAKYIRSVVTIIAATLPHLAPQLPNFET